MTKKLFLAAASVAALAFAGTAQAGSISGYFGTDVAGNKFAAGIPAVGATPAVPAVTYLVASEKIVSGTAKAAGTMYAANELDTPIVVAGGSATRDYLVAFTISGATVASAGLQLNVDADGTGTFVTATSATLVSNTNGVVTYLVSVAGGDEAHAFQLKATVEQSAQAPITVSNTVTAVIGGSNILVDSASSVVAAKYQAFLAPLSATARTLEAKLAVAPSTDDYILVGAAGAPGAASGVLANNFAIVGDDDLADFNVDLAGNDLTLANLFVAGSTLTIKGPVINSHVSVALSTASAAAAGTPPANTVVRTLDVAAATALAAGATNLSITNDGTEEFVPGDYTVTWTPKLAATFTTPAASTATAGTITLEGTNFVAPWVSGTGAAASVIRVSNSNGTASVPVTVRMISGTQVVAGVATPFVSTAAPLVIGAVPANGDLQVTSSQLVAHFGAFTRGDFRVTVNQPETGLVAKLRNTRDGQTFEQSLAD